MPSIAIWHLEKDQVLNVLHFWVCWSQRETKVNNSIKGKKKKNENCGMELFSVVKNNNYDTGFVATAMRIMHEISAMRNEIPFFLLPYSEIPVCLTFFAYLKIRIVAFPKVSRLKPTVDIQANAEKFTNSNT